MSGALLSADQIDAAADLDFVDEIVPEWTVGGKPGKIRLRQLDASDGLELSSEMDDVKNVRNGMFTIIIYCAVDSDMNRLYPTPPRTDPTYNDVMQAHIAKLKKKSMKVLNRLQRVCLRLNGMLKSEIKTDEVAVKKA